MAVTRDDLLHIARLARLGVDPSTLDALTRELSSILAHMDVLARTDTSAVAPAEGVGSGGTPLRSDAGEAPTLDRPLESFAPAMRDKFFIVPRLETHDDQGGAA